MLFCPIDLQREIPALLKTNASFAIAFSMVRIPSQIYTLLRYELAKFYFV